MRIGVLQSASHTSARTDALCTALINELRIADHQTDLITIPPIGDGFAALMAVGAHRLMNLHLSCDAVICLDYVACLTHHERKYALLLDQVPPSSGDSIPAEARYLANLIEAGIDEAKQLQSPVENNSQSSLRAAFDFSAILREFE